MQGKLYRAQSLLESNRTSAANFESLEDTYKDLINYASFAVAWLRNGVPGQDTNRDMFNKKKL
jgi:agmatine/peptidylarginine deiminase